MEKRAMYLSCSTLVFSIDDYPDLETVTEAICELGFAAVDLAAFEGWQNVNPSELARDPRAGRRVRRAVAASGLKVSSLNANTSRSLSDPDAQAFEIITGEYRALAELAAALSCPVITLQPGRRIDGRPPEETISLVSERLGVLAAAGGASLTVEAHHGSILEHPSAAGRVLEKLWPAVGLTYDPSHFVMQEIDPAETEALLDYTRHVHVRGAAPGHMQEDMATGYVDFSWLVSALREKNYRGALAVEYFRGFDADLASTRALRYRLQELGVSL